MKRMSAQTQRLSAINDRLLCENRQTHDEHGNLLPEYISATCNCGGRLRPVEESRQCGDCGAVIEWRCEVCGEVDYDVPF